MKDRRFSEFEKRLRKLQEDREGERKAKEALRTELTSRDSMVTGLQEQLQGAHSRIRSLQAEVMHTHKELKRLRGEKALTETKIDQLKSTYEALVTDLRERIENQEVTIERFEEEISVTFVDRILFDFGKATITPEGEEVLGKVGKALKDGEGRKIRVIGHTDNRPIHPEYYYKFPSNWELAAARASAVVRHF